jgi:uncharacterized membrane protein YdjX (TVP38/TMEM64 family)
MDNTQSPTRNWRRWLGPIAIIALMALGYGLGLHRFLSLQALAENRDALRSFTSANLPLALLAYMLIYTAAVALSVPGAVFLTIAGGFLFGWLVSGMATVIAATLGATVLFQIVKTSFGASLAERAGPSMARLQKGLADDAFNYLLFLRLVPAFPFWLVNIAPALANVKLRTFAAATFLGIIPATFAFAFLGEGLDSIIEGQSVARAACVAEKGVEACPFDISPGSLVTTELLLSFVGVVSLIPVLLKKWKKKNEV